MLSFHPPAPANWSSPLPSLNRATLDPPLFLSPIRRRDALSSFHGLATPVDPNCKIQSHEGEYPAGILERMRPSRPPNPSQFIYTSEGGEQQMVVQATRGYSYSMTNRRPFTLRLTPNGWPFPCNVDLLCTTRWSSPRWRWYVSFGSKKFWELRWKSRDRKSRGFFHLNKIINIIILFVLQFYLFIKCW